MKTIELFCGTKSFSKVAAELGHETFTIDNDPIFEADLTMDIRQMWPVESRWFGLDVLWASPPCQGFSVAVIGRNWNHDGTPKTDSARTAMQLAERTLELIRWMKPKYWLIENPRAMLRKMPFMEEFLKEMGGGQTDYHILPVWGYTHEAYGYFYQLSRLDTTTRLQERRSLP